MKYAASLTSFIEDLDLIGVNDFRKCHFYFLVVVKIIQLMQRLKSRVAYYEKMNESEMTTKQRLKYEKYKQEYEAMSVERKPRRSYATKEEYYEVNKQRAKDRYQRLKNDPEFKNHIREYSRARYQKLKLIKQKT